MKRVLRSLLLTRLDLAPAFVQKIGDETAAGLHSRLVSQWRGLVESSGGLVVADPAVDAYAAVFEGNSSAVQLAIQFQKDLFSKTRPQEVLVTNVIHCGEQDELNMTNTFSRSPSCDLARRILAAANPPQILMSGRVFQDAFVGIANQSNQKLKWRSHGHYGTDNDGVPLTLFEVRMGSDGAWQRPQGILGLNFLTSPYSPTEVLKRYRATQDWLRRCVQVSSDLSLAEQTELILEPLLESADWILSALAAGGPVLCSLKIPDGKRFKCRYRHQGLPLYALLGVDTGELRRLIPIVYRNRSYAGKAMDTGQCIVVPRFNKIDSSSDLHKLPDWPKKLRLALNHLGLAGTAVCPVFAESRQVGEEPLMVLKVDLFENGGTLLDDEFTREVLWLVADLLGSRMERLFRKDVQKRRQKTA